MQFDYKSAKAAISSGILSIQGTVNVNVTGGVVTAQASISGQPVYLVNDGVNNVVAISPTANTVKGLISGQTIRLVDDSVNNVVFAKIDPANNTVKGLISGQTIRLVNDGVNNVVSIDPNNNTVKGLVSGQNIYNYGTTPRVNALVTCIGTSGGTQLPNLPCIRLYVRSVSGNDVMYVGGTGAQAPFSGTGIELYGGEVLPLDVDNANRLQVMAVTANQKVSIFAIDK